MALMSAKNYSFKYRGEDIKAISDINFSIDEGEIILIAGDSGSGKSTFLKSLNGLIPAIVEGKIEGNRYLEGKDFDKIPIYDISRVIGSVFQNPRSQFFTLDSSSELAFPMENYGFSREKMLERIEEIKEYLPIHDLMDRQILSLSNGQRQLLALATSLVLSPKILLFDEPSANLDYGNAMGLRGILTMLKAMGKTVLIADHRFFYLNNLLDRVFLIRNNTIETFDNEEVFKTSDYNTRSFELFNMDIPFRKKTEKGEAVLLIEDISKLPVLRNISLALYRNEIATIVGENGVGKTTLAKILTGSISYDKGRLSNDELPFYVMQDADYQLFGTSVENEVEIGNEGLDIQDKKRVLTELDIWKYRNTHPFDLSGGEKQRLQIAMAALNKAKLIIFDEPTSGLDVKSMNSVVRQINELSETKSILIISHDYEFIRKVSDRVIYLNDGQIEEDFYLNESSVCILNEIFMKMEGKNGK